MSTEIQQLKNKINSLEQRFNAIIQTSNIGVNENFIQHQHTGFDGSKVRIQDLDSIFYLNATIDPSSLADGVGETIQVTGVTGATLGDFVIVSAPYDLQDLTVTVYIQANETVEIRIQNETGGTVDLASGVWRILIIRKIV